MRFSILIIFSFCIGLTANAQKSEQESVIRDLLESRAESLSEDEDISELIENLNRLKKRPINLNKTSTEELKLIIFLSTIQISNFFAHLKENGKLLDLLELQTINGFDTQTIQKILPFVTLNQASEYEKLNLKNISQFIENELLIRASQILEKQKGFTDLPGNRYLGTPERFMLKYKYHFSSIITASVTLDKDAGEKFLAKPFDFYSINVSFYKLGQIKKLIFGDYNLQFGQGLTLWSGFSFGKGAEVTSVAKKDLGLRPYTSANEYSFFRGLSATVELFKNIDITPFISFRKLDASQSYNSDGNLVQASINKSGLHRTPAEIQNKNTLGQNIYGTVIQYDNNYFTIGAIAYHTVFSNDFITQKPTYDRYSFTGSNLTNIGIHTNYTYKNTYFFGEIGKSLGSGTAYVAGAIVSLSSSVSAIVQHRDYAKDYHNFFNQSVAEASEAMNENGTYTGINVVPNKRWSFSAYADYFKFPWLKYRVDAPSSGYEILCAAVFTPSKTLKISARYKTNNKQQNTDLNVPINFLDDVKKESYRFEVKWQLNKVFGFQNHVEVSQYKKGPSNSEFGYLIYQDADFVPKRSKLSANLRIAYFNTPSYNSRIYAYEDDVLYNFTYGMYSGAGFRNYLNLKYSLSKKINIWAKYALFIYQNTQNVGTYLDEIQGNIKSELKFQLRYQF